MLIQHYDLIFSDLDGVAYTGKNVVPAAAETYRRLRQDGIPVMFLTNNASRSAEAVASHLISLGIETSAVCVVSAAAAAADLLAQQVPAGTAAYVVGAQALRDELLARQIKIVEKGVSDFTEIAAVVQGHSPQTQWTDLAAASFAVEAGALWVVANTDTTIPLEQGIAPGNGSLVQAVMNATGKKPLVAGKPERALFDAAWQKHPDRRKPLMLGDRLDTDIQGANAAGIDSALVLTGISTARDALAAPKNQRPTYILESLKELYRPYPHITVKEDQAFVEDGSSRSARLGAVRTREASGKDIVEPVDDSIDSYRAANALLAYE